jgi:glucose-1-phosphate adenylyltransferase
MGDNAVVENSMIYNGCKIGGTVKNSVLFPGVHVKKGAVVENSVIFLSNLIGENCRLNKVVSDVNNSYGDSVRIGPEECKDNTAITMVGWNNKIPDNTTIGEGATIYPRIPPANWPIVLQAGEVLR